MGADEDIPLILGRPFLYTMNTVIYVGSSQIHIQFLGRKVKCAFNGYKVNKQVKAVCPKRRSRPTKHQGNKKDKQAKKDEQVKEDKPVESKPQPKPKKVWQKKVASSCELPPLEAPLQEPLSPGSNEEQFKEQSNSEDLKH